MTLVERAQVVKVIIQRGISNVRQTLNAFWSYIVSNQNQTNVIP